jgi:hypothetical protein
MMSNGAVLAKRKLLMIAKREIWAFYGELPMGF